jgi:hypothetical protein
MGPGDTQMRILGILGLCLTLTLMGCDGGSTSQDPFADSVGDAIEISMVVATVLLVAGGVAIYDSVQRADNRYHFRPGLNIKAPEQVGNNKTFEVRVAVADAKSKPQKAWWIDGRAPLVTIVAMDGASSATLVSTEVRKEWHVGKYSVPRPGPYLLSVQAPVPGDSAGSPVVQAEASWNIAAK